MFPGQLLGNGMLDQGGILAFVDEEIIVAPLVFAEQLPVLLQRQLRPGEHIVEIHQQAGMPRTLKRLIFL
ncbi:hypothetical protein D3C75_644020 [compost metagenome]